MITYHGLGYWGLLLLLPLALALRVLTGRAHRAASRTLLWALALIAAIVVVSY